MAFGIQAYIVNSKDVQKHETAFPITLDSFTYFKIILKMYFLWKNKIN